MSVLLPFLQFAEARTNSYFFSSGINSIVSNIKFLLSFQVNFCFYDGEVRQHILQDSCDDIIQSLFLLIVLMVNMYTYKGSNSGSNTFASLPHGVNS